MARKEADEKRLQFAAHLFVFTTKDGMIISHLTHVLPSKLYQWATTEAWKDAPLCWGYTGDCRIEGEDFHRQVGLSLMKRSLQEAERLWKELFGVRTYAVERSKPCSSAIHRRYTPLPTPDESGNYSEALGL